MFSPWGGRLFLPVSAGECGDVIGASVLDEVGAGLMKGEHDVGGMTLPADVLHPFEVEGSGIFAGFASYGHFFDECGIKPSGEVERP